MWGATVHIALEVARLGVSIHAPRVGCDLSRQTVQPNLRCFNSRTPCGVRRQVCYHVDNQIGVSIHAPRVGCDGWYGLDLAIVRVSIHAPRVGCDLSALESRSLAVLFQFTHPVWGATWGVWLVVHSWEFQFTHPVWGATDRQRVDPRRCTFQFTHPVWGATSNTATGERATKFQFTHPVWGATAVQIRVYLVLRVSIHAPRVGCDCYTSR